MINKDYFAYQNVTWAGRAKLRGWLTTQLFWWLRVVMSGYVGCKGQVGYG